MPKTSQSFPQIDTWMAMSEREQDAIIQAIEKKRRRQSWTIPLLALAIIAMAIASSWYYVLA